MFNIFKRVTALEEQQEYTITKQIMDKKVKEWQVTLDEYKLLVFVTSVSNQEYTVLGTDFDIPYTDSYFTLDEMCSFIQ